MNAWAAMNATYVTQFGDLPAWYVENSNTAMLAAAAWQCNCPALCEPNVDKQKFTGRPGRPKSFVGRLDMELYVEDSWLWIEAKKDHFLYTYRADGRSDRRKRLVNLIDRSRRFAKESKKAAEADGWSVVAAAFFSASVAANSIERGKDRSLRDGFGKEDAVNRAIYSENAAMIEKLESYRLEVSSLQYAVFRNTNTRLQEWAGVEYPAAFGIITSRL
ncbi:hypothetical protein RGD00_21480 [Xinfangfangia sp. LG-4]|uniref:Uncharacterized protein n=2 Tax=Ruixingdingia sedimenti TaxID=3073604 RepID=A0ABU1FE63_9RHOB|nr:hypothetical protein [Xinfangfangia sp. LG-4]